MIGENGLDIKCPYNLSILPKASTEISYGSSRTMTVRNVINGQRGGKFDASFLFLLLTLFLTIFTIVHRQQICLRPCRLKPLGGSMDHFFAVAMEEEKAPGPVVFDSA